MNQLPEFLINLLQLLVKPTWKKSCVVLALFLISSIYYSYKLDKEITSHKIKNDELVSKSENCIADLTKNVEKSKILGCAIEVPNTVARKSAIDFASDWDTDSFYIVDTDTFCPKQKGKNNFQRIIYKNTTPLAGTDFILKFRMIEQQEVKLPNPQRVVLGVKIDGNIFSEYDIPTKDEQVINFRINSLNGDLVSGGEGKQISSPIKDKSTINLHFQTKPKHGQEITQILDLGYISSIDKYGEESDSVSYDSSVNDSKPEALRSNIFIGSYVGSCIKVLDWSIN